MRNDIHCPSKIEPADYEYVAITYFGGQGINYFYDQPYITAERKKLQDHMTKTGGKYSKHEHGGTCYCCGASAIYTVAFYHAKSNSYIKVGQTCAEKLDLSFDSGDMNLFRKNVRQALKIAKGKAKAKAALEELGLLKAWDISEAVKKDYKFGRYEEQIITDLVYKLGRYDLTQKQVDFLKKLLYQIENREVIAKQREEDRANAEPCPKGKVEFKGQIINIKNQSSFYGTQTKMLVKSDTGFLAFGTLPRGLGDDNVQRGDRVQFTATFNPTEKDTKFGFFKRPTKAIFSRNI